MQNIRCRTIVFTTLILLVGLVSGARGQEKSALFSIGGGFTAPNSEVRDHLGDGFNFNIGVQFNATPVVGIEGLYSFNGLGQKQISLPVSITPSGSGVPTDFFGDMNMQFGTANLVVQKPDGAVRPYGLVGMVVYYRPIKVTTPGVGFVPGSCSPWWYVCYPGGLVPVTNIVGERSSTDFGMDFGGGVNFNVVFAGAPVSLHLRPDNRSPDSHTTRDDHRPEGQRPVHRTDLRRALLTAISCEPPAFRIL